MGGNSERVREACHSNEHSEVRFIIFFVIFSLAWICFSYSSPGSRTSIFLISLR